MHRLNSAVLALDIALAGCGDDVRGTRGRVAHPV